MATGRRPKPTALKLVNGNPGKRPLPKNEPCPSTELPRLAPKSWGTNARKEYGRIKKALDELGAATGPDLESLRFYCEAAADHAVACEALDLADKKKRPILYGNDQGRRRNVATSPRFSRKSRGRKAL